MTILDQMFQQVDELLDGVKGGQGSGNYGHAGRKGKQGGSARRGGGSGGGGGKISAVPDWDKPPGWDDPPVKVKKTWTARKLENKMKKGGLGSVTVKRTVDNKSMEFQVGVRAEVGGKNPQVKFSHRLSGGSWTNSDWKGFSDTKTASQQAEKWLYGY